MSNALSRILFVAVVKICNCWVPFAETIMLMQQVAMAIVPASRKASPCGLALT